MVVAHNLQAANSNRQFGIVTGEKQKSTEKLSSGYRINRSADDAAGLSISEKMRWQIRGLDKGATNIGDGISLIQTAEGALNEVHSILQRVRELSVQALNDTNTESDRDKIQLEVSESLDEIDHIRDTTMFNTKTLLQGNEVKNVKVTPDQTVEYTYTTTVAIKKPQWLHVDERMEVHSEYGYGTQDIDGRMFKTIIPNEDDEDQTITGIYYGKDDGDIVYDGIVYKHAKDSNGNNEKWTDLVNDNPSAKVDFSALKSAESVDDLNDKLRNLLGVKITFPCGTCNSIVNSVQFVGSRDNYSANVSSKNRYDTDYRSVVNINSIKINYDFEDGEGSKEYSVFEAVDKLMDMYADNYDGDDDNNIEGEKEKAQKLADCIAKKLRDVTYNALKKTTEQGKDHFERVIKGNDYSLVMYDYRDYSKLTDYHADILQVDSYGQAEITVPATSFVEGITIPVESKLNIMCGALNTSYVALDLPDISLDSLGLVDYRVDRYDTQIYETYDLSDEERKKYEDELARWKATGHNVKHTGTYTTKELDSYTPGKPAKTKKGFDANGEPMTIVTQKAIPAVTTFKDVTKNYEYTTTEYDGPMPTPPESKKRVKIVKHFDPSSLDLVDEAIDKVSRNRAMLGAQQNRLEYAFAITTNTSENTSASESRIRDTDMAEEMVNYSKHSILEQSGQSMIAQANQTQQGVLSILG